MIYSDSSPITFDDPLPDEVDVVVIGGGVIGVSTAWFLLERGHRVLICDKGRIAGEQSSRNWGWIRQQSRDADELPIAIDSVNTWERLAPEIRDLTGVDIGFERRGVLYAASDDEQLNAYESWLDVAEQHQLDTRMLSAAEVDDLVRDRPGQWRGGLFTPSDGRAEPFRAVPALAKALYARGGSIRERCAVRDVEKESGRLHGVVTEYGRVRTQAVVCAAGAWATLFLANLGIRFPQLTVRATVARTARAPNIYDGGAALGEVAIRRRRDGGYTVAASGTNEHYIGADSFRYFFDYSRALSASSRYLKLRFDDGLIDRLRPTRRWRADEVSPFEVERVLNPAPSPRALNAMRAGLEARLPKIAHLPFEESWAGMIDVTPDVVPVMDEIDEFPGLYLAAGFSGHGFGIGPGAGQVMADLVEGKRAAHDLTRFRFSRFSDGSEMRPGPGL